MPRKKKCVGIIALDKGNISCNKESEDKPSSKKHKFVGISHQSSNLSETQST